MHARGHLTQLAAIASMLICATALAEDIQVAQLQYKNCGAYLVKNTYVHWKAGDQKDQQRFTRSLAFKEFGCYDLGDIGVPEGAEVWMSFDIAGGDTESCRKDNTRFIYASASTARQGYLSRGETLTNNRCQLDTLQKAPVQSCMNKDAYQSDC
jgi:hypothetical protein